MRLEHSGPVDAVAIAFVISSAAVGLTGAGVAFYSPPNSEHGTGGRAEQRAADGYLKVLSLAKHEAQEHPAVHRWVARYSSAI